MTGVRESVIRRRHSEATTIDGDVCFVLLETEAPQPNPDIHRRFLGPPNSMMVIPRRGVHRPRKRPALVRSARASEWPLFARTGLRRSGQRDRHGPRGSQIRAGSEASNGGNVGGLAAAQCLRSVDLGGSRGPRSRWTAPSMARPFGRRSACPSPALALNEGARLSTPVRRFRRSRQIDPAEPSLRKATAPASPSTGAPDKLGRASH